MPVTLTCSRSSHAVQHDMLMRMPQLTAAIVHHGAACSAPARAMPSDTPQRSCARLHSRERPQQHVARQPDRLVSPYDLLLNVQL
jgi:hypothetical protein